MDVAFAGQHGCWSGRAEQKGCRLKREFPLPPPNFHLTGVFWWIQEPFSAEPQRHDSRMNFQSNDSGLGPKVRATSQKSEFRGHIVSLDEQGTVRWRKYRVVPRAHPLRPCVLLILFNRSGSQEGFRLPGATWDHFRCTVEPSPGHIRC